jgi:selenocysteine-specific elongation factor
MRVIGTAGHVDHGKSTLIEALTGTHPDRLREEQEREMTIVLGFAWLTLPGGEEVGIVDVPGHRDFVENMLSGVGAIDAALFVVAADEGVMPQTREHLAILDLLQIQGGVIALTKVDLIDDPDWLDLVEADLRETLTGTVLERVPLVRVSARTGQGIPELKQTLDAILAGRPPRLDLGRPRLPVDRVFTMTGFGTVVTGTLTDGQLQAGEEVLLLPQMLRGRIRGLQTHKRKEKIAYPGSRTAVNISGVDVDQIQRGAVVAHPGDYVPTRRLDVRFRLLPDASHPVRHNMEVKLFVGAAEVVARLRLLGAELLKPGEEGWLQLELSAPVVAIRGDRYILRRPSPGETLGGGVIVDAQPAGRHRRFSQKNIERMQSLLGGTPEDVVLQASLALGIATVRDVLAHSNLEIQVAEQALAGLLAQKIIQRLDADARPLLPDSQIVSQSYWSQLTLRAEQALAQYHQAYPLRAGMPREEFKSRLKLNARFFNDALRKWIDAGIFEELPVRAGLPGVSPVPTVRLPGREINFSPAQQSEINKLQAAFAANPFSPPTVKDSIALVGEETYNALIDLGILIPLTGEVVFRKQDYDALVLQVRQMLEKEGTISVAQVRDRFDTSRRYVLAFLEHLDAIGVTVRDGDARKLK